MLGQRWQNILHTISKLGRATCDVEPTLAQCRTHWAKLVQCWTNIKRKLAIHWANNGLTLGRWAKLHRVNGICPKWPNVFPTLACHLGHHWSRPHQNGNKRTPASSARTCLHAETKIHGRATTRGQLGWVGTQRVQTPSRRHCYFCVDSHQVIHNLQYKTAI